MCIGQLANELPTRTSVMTLHACMQMHEKKNLNKNPAYCSYWLPLLFYNGRALTPRQGHEQCEGGPPSQKDFK